MHRNFSRKIYHRVINEKDLRIIALTDIRGTTMKSYLTARIAISEFDIYEILVKIAERERVNKLSTRWSIVEDLALWSLLRLDEKLYTKLKCKTSV